MACINSTSVRLIYNYIGSCNITADVFYFGTFLFEHEKSQCVYYISGYCFIIFLDIVYYIMLYFWILFIIFLDIKYSKYSENIPKRAAAHALVGGLLGERGRVRRLKIFSRKCMLKPTWKMNRDSARVQLKGEAEELIPSSNMQ